MNLIRRLPLLPLAIAILASVVVYGYAGLNDALRLAILMLIALLVIVTVYRDLAQQNKAAANSSRLAAIISLSDDAIVTKDLDGMIESWSLGAERLFTYTAAEMIGRSIQIIYPPDRIDEFQNILSRLKQGESIDHFDTVRVAKGGRRIDVSVSETLVRDAQGKVIGASKVMRDITPRKYAEEITRFFSEVNDVLASSLDYKTTLTSIARLAVPQIADWCAVHVKTDDGSIQQLALTHADSSRVEFAQGLLRHYLDDPSSPYGVMNVIRTGKPTLAPPPPFGAPPVTLLNSGDGSKDPSDPGLKSLMVVPLIAPAEIFGAITFVSAESGRHYGQADLALAQDLARRAALAVDNARLYQKAQSLNEELDQRVAERTSELKIETANHQRSAEQLRLLAVHLQSVLEEERIRIAREVHDQLGQMMTAVKMDLSLMERKLRHNGSPESLEALGKEIGGTTQLVDDAIATMHEIVHELRPAVLDHLGLRAAIEWQLQDFQERSKIECDFDSDLDGSDIDPARSTALFRILQETLTNAARHAQATHIQASLHKQNQSLVLQVRDNGMGISKERIENVKTFGLAGMRERALVFGGDVLFDGSPGDGTVVTVRIPV